MIFGIKNEFSGSIENIVKEKLETPIYGIFALYWAIFHWKFLVTLFFVSESKIWSLHHTLKTDYLSGLLFNINSGYSLAAWLMPFVLTYITIWKLPDWFLIQAFAENEKYKTQRAIVTIDQQLKLKKREGELEKADAEKLKAVQKKAETEKSIEKINPEIKWERRYREFRRDQDIFSKFPIIIESVYQRGGQIAESSLDEEPFQIPPDVLAYVDTNGIVEIDLGRKRIILTPMGKFFVRRFLSDQKLRINKALYGTFPDKVVDITSTLNQMIENNKITFIVGNELSGIDPDKGINKFLEIEYQLGDRIVKKRFKEYDKVSLP